MTAFVHQKMISGDLSVGATNNHNRTGIVFNATSEDEAVATIIADTTNFPATMTTIQAGVTYNFVLATVKAEPLEDGRDPPTTWEAFAEYNLQGQVTAPYQTGDAVTTFEIGTTAVNTKYNKNWVTGTHRYAVAGETAPDFNGFINVTSGNMGTIEGVDIDVPTFTWSETHYVADADVTTSYINALYAAVNNPINDDTFRNLAAGEAKILGVQGSRRFRGGDWELNFRFAGSPNVTSLEVGHFNVADGNAIDKKGWEYLWFYYVPRTASTMSLVYLIQFAKAAYVEEIYGSSDFSTLGIGTT